jgi:hypothetical protein
MAVVFGLSVAVGVLRSAIRTVVLPRSEVVPLTRAVFAGLRKVFDMFARDKRTYDERDRVMALFAPVGLMLLAASWALCVILAFTLVFWGLGVDPLRQAFVTSGSSFTTLGFAPPRDLPTDVAAVGEAVIGLGLVALLISFLPSIYSAFQRRELMVSLLQVRAGGPPTAVKLILRHHRIGMLDGSTTQAAELFKEWLDFSGWRVNYDTVLITLAGFFMAPYAPWSSDRSIRYRIRSRKITTLGDAFRRFRQFVRPSRVALAPDED